MEINDLPQEIMVQITRQRIESNNNFNSIDSCPLAVFMSEMIGRKVMVDRSRVLDQLTCDILYKLEKPFCFDDFNNVVETGEPFITRALKYVPSIEEVVIT